MSDPRHTLQSKFREQHRYVNFGNILTRMEVHGFRLHQATAVDLLSPVTAFCGHNGTRKTTLLQLAACAFREGQRGHKLSDFFAAGPLDPAPFAEDAQLSCRFGRPKAETAIIHCQSGRTDGQITGRAISATSSFWVRANSSLVSSDKISRFGMQAA